MAIKHDGQGFLVGDPIDVESMAGDIAAMRGDIHGIREAMEKLLLSGAPKAGKHRPDAAPITAQRASRKPRADDDAAPAAVDVGGRRAKAAAQRVVDKALRRIGAVGPPQGVATKGNSRTQTAGQTSANSVPPAAQPAAPTSRDKRGRFKVRSSALSPPLPGVQAPVLPGAQAPTQPKTPATPPVKAKDEENKKNKKDGEDEDSNSVGFRSAVDGIAGKISSAVKESADGIAESDPAVKAMQEVAAPISRGWQLLKGDGGGKRERWYRRILTALVGFRKDESVANKKTDKRLKAIEEKKGAGEEGSGGGMWGLLLAALGGVMALLKNLPVIGPIIKGIEGAVLALRSLPILRLIPGFGRKPTVAPGGAAVAGGPKPPPLPGENKPGFLKRMWNRVRGVPAEGAKPPPLPGAAVAGAEGAAAEGASAGRLARLVKLGGGAARFAKRIPILGTLLTAGLAVMGSSAIENDDTKTRQEKNKEQGRNWGGAAGGLGGAMAGASAMGSLGLAVGTVFPGIGNIIGGAIGVTLGAILGGIGGEKLVGSIGEWIGEHWADLTDTLSSAWDEVKAVGLGTWDWIRGGFDTVKTYAMGAFDALKGYVTEKWDKFVGIATAAFNGVRDGLTQLGTWLKSLPVIGPIIRAAEEAARKAAEESARLAKAAAEAAKKKAEETAAGGRQLAKDVKDAAVNRVQQTVAGGRQLAGDVSDAVTGTDAYKAWDSRVQARRAEAAATKGSAKERKNFEDARGYLQDASDKAGVSGELVAKTARFESGFDPNAAPIDRSGKRLSSAHGYGQITDSTWATLFRKYGEKYGAAGASKMSNTQTYRFRGDKKMQAGMLAELTRENVEIGKKYGGTNDDANVYALHNLGDPVGRKFLSALRENPNKLVRDVLSAREISNNKSLYGNGSITLSEAYSRMGNAMESGAWAANQMRKGGQAAPPTASVQPSAVAATANRPAPQPAPQAVAPAAPVVVAPPTASVQSPAVAPKAQAPDPAPAITTTVAATAGKRVGTDSTFGNRDVGQDVRERGIAHIVTGGLASSGIG